jgi:hypothetical protein
MLLAPSMTADITASAHTSHCVTLTLYPTEPSNASPRLKLQTSMDPSVEASADYAQRNGKPSSKSTSRAFQAAPTESNQVDLSLCTPTCGTASPMRVPRPSVSADIDVRRNTAATALPQVPTGRVPPPCGAQRSGSEFWTVQARQALPVAVVAVQCVLRRDIGFGGHGEHDGGG